MGKIVHREIIDGHATITWTDSKDTDHADA
jgi:hypothetical protein